MKGKTPSLQDQQKPKATATTTRRGKRGRVDDEEEVPNEVEKEETKTTATTTTTTTITTTTNTKRVKSDEDYRLSREEMKLMQKLFKVTDNEIDTGKVGEERNFPYYNECEVKNEDYYNPSFDKNLLDIEPEEYWVEFTINKARVNSVEDMCVAFNLDLVEVKTRVQMIKELISSVRRESAIVKGEKDDLPKMPDFLMNHPHLNYYTFYSKDRKLTCTTRFFDDSEEKLANGELMKATRFHVVYVTAEVHRAVKACVWWKENTPDHVAFSVSWGARTNVW